MTDDVITEFLRKRTIISDFQLIEHIICSKNNYEILHVVQDEVKLSEDQLIPILEHRKKIIADLGTFIEKNAMSILSKTEGKVLYQFDIKDKTLYQATLICEIFRYPGISKNSSRLNIRKLQHHIASLLAEKDSPLELVIAWGQAKQTCGLLKTPGPMADMAEVFAIVQLSVILQAIKKILGGKRKVRLKVLTGASRFAMALYPNIVVNEQYDSQRQNIADYFNDQDEIIFKPYSQSQDTSSDSYKNRLQSFEDNCKLVQPQHIAKIYNHMLLSINWHNVMKTQYRIDSDFKEENYLSDSICHWVKEQADFETVLRMAIVCLLRRKHPSAFFSSKKEDYKQLVQLTSAMDAITKNSAKKYIALQYTHATFDIDRHEKDTCIRLSVHEKKDHPEIPTIFTLGKVGGNYLSQNITVYVEKEGKVRFKSLVEILDEYKVKAVYAQAGYANPLPLSWLHDKQPICFVDKDCPDELVPEILKKFFKSWLEDILEI